MADKPIFCYPEKDKISGKYTFTCVSGGIDNQKHCQFYEPLKNWNFCCFKEGVKCTCLEAQEEASKIIKEE